MLDSVHEAALKAAGWQMYQRHIEIIAVGHKLFLAGHRFRIMQVTAQSFTGFVNVTAETTMQKWFNPEPLSILIWSSWFHFMAWVSLPPTPKDDMCHHVAFLKTKFSPVRLFKDSGLGVLLLFQWRRDNIDKQHLSCSVSSTKLTQALPFWI